MPLALFQAPRYKTPFPLIERPPDDFARDGGRFGAARGGGRMHLGIDLFAPPGTLVVAPWDCEVQRTGIAYSGDARLTLLVIVPTHLEGEYFKLLYVAPVASLIGATVPKGEVIGRVQDLSVRYPVDRDHPGGMVNHIHVERWVYANARWERVDPTEAVFGKAAQVQIA